jgi:hypothetical protein
MITPRPATVALLALWLLHPSLAVIPPMDAAAIARIKVSGQRRGTYEGRDPEQQCCHCQVALDETIIVQPYPTALPKSGSWLSVAWTGVATPGESDFIAAYSPPLWPDAPLDATTRAPVKVWAIPRVMTPPPQMCWSRRRTRHGPSEGRGHSKLLRLMIPFVTDTDLDARRYTPESRLSHQAMSCSKTATWVDGPCNDGSSNWRPRTRCT